MGAGKEPQSTATKKNEITKDFNASGSALVDKNVCLSKFVYLYFNAFFVIKTPQQLKMKIRKKYFVGFSVNQRRHLFLSE